MGSNPSQGSVFEQMQRASNNSIQTTEKLMKMGDDYYKVLPAQMTRIATEQLATPAPPTVARKKAWEQVGLIAKLLQAKAKVGEELKEEMVDEIMKKMEAKMEEEGERTAV
ncbi:hypothetical protein BT96DRAFT_986901 [Gymnopus androsaceus JB14]|uniref:Uncharacterized protein n=1 Tax=Gymnopus androsaceus JB14 TaxID=1447944 RepID=A0A6A4IAW3_9AGAR|nr:hypothetical protein BT96DRAFT_986901 [Gymnopus androsaceus JB14]